ncbi:EEF1A lysine methyltransferase 4 isoform X2 [Zootoca vivipara]|uniref:EEF1A lysine methyltransferase 4 isoform X2 n=1 Tax=Zootoca vivipara TaxID=8524 RepID=UPI00293BC7AB|nr:EEF1A lysine methyltransferase 4 isoform X2 [Zootoca vivipara]
MEEEEEEVPRRRQLPDSNARYRDRSFWDSRYQDEGAAPAEWFGGLERFREQLEAELSPGDRILVLGCGNSALSYNLFQLGYTDITSIDYSPICIASVRDRYAHCPGLHWAVMDAQALTFVDGSFDVVLEKGTLDSMMVEETDPWNVSSEARVLLDQVLTEVSGKNSCWYLGRMAPSSTISMCDFLNLGPFPNFKDVRQASLHWFFSCLLFSAAESHLSGGKNLSLLISISVPESGLPSCCNHTAPFWWGGAFHKPQDLPKAEISDPEQGRKLPKPIQSILFIKFIYCPSSKDYSIKTQNA